MMDWIKEFKKEIYCSMLLLYILFCMHFWWDEHDNQKVITLMSDNLVSFSLLWNKLTTFHLISFLCHSSQSSRIVKCGSRGMTTTSKGNKALKASVNNSCYSVLFNLLCLWFSSFFYFINLDYSFSLSLLRWSGSRVRMAQALRTMS